MRLTNLEISEILQEYAKEVKQQFLLYTVDNDNVITIYNDRPGLLIGKAGCLVEKYKKKLNSIVDEHNSLIEKINQEKRLVWEGLSKKEKKGKVLVCLSKYPYVKINFIECQNSLVNSRFDPMSMGF